jgi:metallo-beta-lactamase family protein
MHLVEAAGKKLLLDCGSYQGKRAEARERNCCFPFAPHAIDAVILSHAHIDHCGNLPNLVRQGFTGPIWCTPATRDLAAAMLADAVKIQEEDAAYLNRHRDKGEPKVEPLFTRKDVHQTVRAFESLRYDKPAEVLPGLRAQLVDAGHLLGSAMVSLHVPGSNGHALRLTFTGDLGRRGLPILRDPAPVPAADLLISESTYGGRVHPPVESLADGLAEVMRRTAGRGGKVLIPAFSLGRTQTVVYYLHQLTSQGRLADLPIFVDSPLAAEATEIFRLHPECFDEETARLLEDDPDLFGGKRIHYIHSVEESKALNGRTDPCVIIAASGMCESGRILHHLKHNLGDARNTVLIVGYQAPETVGWRLVKGQKEVRILDRRFAVHAEIVVMNEFSSHADRNDLLAALGPLAGQARSVRLVHGDPEQSEALAQALREHGFSDVAVPERGQSVRLE